MVSMNAINGFVIELMSTTKGRKTSAGKAISKYNSSISIFGSI